jgi:RNA polymerase subunit RPABC4/transcription elongation factor Spt4
MSRYNKARHLTFTHQVRCIDSSNSSGVLETGRIYTATRTLVPRHGVMFLEIDPHYWPAERFVQVLSLHKEIQMKTFKCPKCDSKAEVIEWDDMNLDGVFTKKFNVLCPVCHSFSRSFNCGDYIPVSTVLNSMRTQQDLLPKEE